MNGALFSDLLSSITERGRQILGRRTFVLDPGQRAADLVGLCHALLSGRGEASGSAIAAEILERYARLDRGGQLAFFEALATEFGPDSEKLATLIAAWQADPSAARAGDLHFNSEPRRQELFRRLNRAPGATGLLVNMRADLLALLPAHKHLEPVDRDFAHLLISWFNRGFLVLRRIDWSAPAIVLEKLIRYEAVHEIRGFADLRRRIDPSDRRCYGFFHPALLDEPLIFVEVALTAGMPEAIAPVLAEDRTPVAVEQARTAVFYSISNCQQGLAGISFGNFLIKQVVEELRREMPQLDCFVTLSPVPGFMRWLKRREDVPLAEDDLPLLAHLEDNHWIDDAALCDRMKRILEPLAAHYFLKAKRPDARPLDSVARFHLGNGARLERIDWLGDRSDKGLAASAGLMVNYLYDLNDIEKNHEIFANSGDVVASNVVRKMLKAETRPRFALISG